jgi:hypothetical protein
MSKVHIGKKIKEILDRNPMSVVDFAESIGLTRNGAYKVFEKETIDTGQLQKISIVLGHDFFEYYKIGIGILARENKGDYGYATRADLDELTAMVKVLVKEIAKVREDYPQKKKPGGNYSRPKKG